MGRVSGKVALISGAARGQGRSHAIRLAEEGADIIAFDICEQIDTIAYPMATPDDLQETVRQVEKLDRRIVAQQADVRDYEGIRRVVDAGMAEFGHIDIVCANAGISSYGLTWEMSAEAWQDTIDVDLTGVWNTIRAPMAAMIERGEGGSVIITSSSAALVGIPTLSHYTAAKTGVLGLARSLCQEVGQYGIRVNTLHPTGVDTNMALNAGTYELFCPDIENPTKADVEPIFRAQNVLPIPWVDPRDISNAVLWLASDEARYVTGAAIPVDAGCTQKYPGT